MRIILLTSLERGIASLALPKLLENGHEVAGIVYSLDRGKQPSRMRRLKKLKEIGPLGALAGIRMRKWYFDKPAERLKLSPIQEIAAKLNVPLWTVPSINSPEGRTAIREAGAEIGIALGTNYIHQETFSIPNRGMINIHHEIVPNYKGAQSVIWQIHDGSKETGYTIHKVSRALDGGDILYQERVPITFSSSLRDTVIETVTLLYCQSINGLVWLLNNFDEQEQLARPQTNGRTFTTPSGVQFLRMLLQHRRLRNRCP